MHPFTEKVICTSDGSRSTPLTHTLLQILVKVYVPCCIAFWHEFNFAPAVKATSTMKSGIKIIYENQNIADFLFKINAFRLTLTLKHEEL